VFLALSGACALPPPAFWFSMALKTNEGQKREYLLFRRLNPVLNLERPARLIGDTTLDYCAFSD